MGLRRGLLVVALIAAAAAAEATYPAPPDGVAEFCVDEAGLLGGARDGINATVLALRAEGRDPIFVVTIRSLAAYGADRLGIETYAGMLFDAWGIGSRGANRGILLLVARRDRKARIELGAGWGRTHDATARHIMDRVIVPDFKLGRYAAGLRAGVAGLDAMARGRRPPAGTRPRFPVGAALLFGGVVLVFVVWYALAKAAEPKPWRARARAHRRSRWRRLAAKRERRDWLQHQHLVFRGGGGGGFGGGGSSFGGGSSGGGGATGSW